MTSPLYSMAEGGHRRLPAEAMVRVHDINKILAEHEAIAEEIPEPIKDFLISELLSFSSKTDLERTRLRKKHQKDADIVTSRESLGVLLSHFDQLANSSTDLETDRLWKASMEPRTQDRDGGKTQMNMIKNKIEDDCLAY